MTDLVTFQVWQGSQNVFKGVDVGGLVSSDVTIEAADFVVPAGLETVGSAFISGRRAWIGFRCDTPGMFWVKVGLDLSDGQNIMLGFYIQVVATPA